jgi:endo-1,3-1,4-beta-glycanase ExoK
LVVASALPALGGGRNPAAGGWQDNFDGKTVDARRWVVVNDRAPGYIPDQHLGYCQPDRVSIKSGFLSLRLTQGTGQVDSNPSGIISRGAAIYTKALYGYGTYEWNMRMSSTAASPRGAGDAVSGSVSAGFIYVNNSETEIDFEFPGDQTDALYMVNWHNPNPSSDPTDADSYSTRVVDPEIAHVFRTYKFVWEPGKITFYVDGEWKAEHTTNVPSAPAHFMINHWGTNIWWWGGWATLGVSRYFHVDWVRYTPQQ